MIINGNRQEQRDKICTLQLSTDQNTNYRLQGRVMKSLGIPSWLAHYPDDTYVGTLRLEGWKEVEVNIDHGGNTCGRIVQSYPPTPDPASPASGRG